ncbi:DUF6458 family protein [Tessaracoccus antarcticus]|uniref:DUF6458 domain-containing protein n=1 Tax=Tessaracoccus antarcticus TaxID=2479848 RepID=A0A3M0GW76_9ACTN|nr:DUF6458 family protein [Tessaracoccus antarcticus]RMB61596.1 hypothetical protein EAX62_02905 [Tessaracoccus antarcticus]
MRIGTSIFLLALGAVLAFAVNAEVPFISLDLVGYILMACGVVGLIWSLMASQRNRSVETRTVNDPGTGETITRSESHDGL